MRAFVISGRTCGQSHGDIFMSNTDSAADTRSYIRGPDKKPRKRRTDNPASYLPKTAVAHRIARERGSRIGRRAGSRNGWTREEQEIRRELAQAEAKLITDFLLAVGAWPTREQQIRLFRSLDPELVARSTQMEEHRARRLAAQAEPRGER
jgi:hypothetical protein